MNARESCVLFKLPGRKIRVRSLRTASVACGRRHGRETSLVARTIQGTNILSLDTRLRWLAAVRREERQKAERC